MRIIAGQLRGRKLATLKGTCIRPTADRTREALFNILAHRPRGSRVLDLYCGTGALGLEALSRGAAEAVFVDNAPLSLAVLRKNITLCQMMSRSHIIHLDILRGLDCLTPHPFDLIFMDPPYGLGLISKTLGTLSQTGLIKPGALIIAEHSAAVRIDPIDHNLEIIDQRRYGKTELTFFAASP